MGLSENRVSQSPMVYHEIFPVQVHFWRSISHFSDTPISIESIYPDLFICNATITWWRTAMRETSGETSVDVLVHPIFYLGEIAMGKGCDFVNLPPAPAVISILWVKLNWKKDRCWQQCLHLGFLLQTQPEWYFKCQWIRWWFRPRQPWHLERGAW